MELTQLRYFAAVAESLHMTRTAERLHIAQPALSQSIARLEQELGVLLFHRAGRHLTLTPCGKYMLERLQQPLATLEALPTELTSMAESEQRTIRLNVLAATSLVTDAIIAYRRHHPDIHFLLQQDAAETGYDLSVTTSAEAPSDSGASVFVEEIFLVVPAAGRFGNRQHIRLAEVADEPFISLAGTRRLRGICDRYCMQAGFTPHVDFESDNPASVKKLIAAHAGVGFWPAFSWGRSVDPDVRYISITDPDCRRYLILTENVHKPMGRAAADFKQYLAAFIGERAESAEI